MRATITQDFELDSDNPKFAYQIPGTHNSPTITALTDLADTCRLASSGPEGASLARCRDRAGVPPIEWRLLTNREGTALKETIELID